MWIVIILLVIVCLVLFGYIKKQGADLTALRKSDTTKTAFIKALSREIRTPLHSVSGLAEIIAKDDLYLSKGEKKDISEQIRYNAGIISTLLEEVSYFTSGDGEGGQRKDERFSPTMLCQRCIDAHFSSLKNGVKLVFRRGLPEEFFVINDPHIIELVVNKLLTNACAFTDKGEVTLSCRCDKAAQVLTFIIDDTGSGIPEHLRSQLFSWFDNPGDERFDTEFDLSVAQRLAGKVGGFIQQDETYQQGTRMEFTIPYQAVPAIDTF